MSCPDEDSLIAFATEGAGAQTSALEAHLDGCDGCRAVVSGLLEQESGPPAHAFAVRYEVLGLLGEGGMGEVYLALDRVLGRHVALKQLRRAKEGGSAEPAEGLVREARALARLSHPCVVQVYDVGVLDGQWFICLEYVEGVTLSSWLAQGTHSQAAVLGLFEQAARGLAAAHAARLVHRDFKPSNVLVSPDGRARITDFGLALDPSTGERAESLAGTPAYLAPELRLGRPADARSDQYSFCVSLYEALYGRRPSKPGEVRLPSTPRVPGRVRRLLQRGLAAEPAERLASMERCAAALAPPPRWVGWARRAGVAAAAAAVVAALVGVQAWRRGIRCAASAGQIEQVWNAQARATQRQAFERELGPTAGGAAADAVAAALDAYAGSWATSARATCEQGASGEQAPAQQECLRQRLTELKTAVALFAVADRAVLLRAPLAVRALPYPALCPAAAADALAQAPADPRRVELREQRARAVVYEQAGRLAQALEAAQAARRLAEALGRAEDQARALLAEGTLLQKLSRYDEVPRPLFGAAALAEAGHLESVLGRTRLQLASLALRRGNLEEGFGWVKLAEESLQRAPELALRVDLAALKALLLTESGKLEEALEVASKARREAARLDAGEREVAGRVRGAVAFVLFRSMRYPEAEAEYRELINLRAQELGEEHPDVARLRNSLAGALGGQGRYEDALAIASRARADLAAALGPADPATLQALFNVASAQAMLERGPGALQAAREGAEIAERALGPDHPTVIRFLNLRASVLTHVVKDLPGGLRAFEESLQRLGRAKRLQTPTAVETYSGLARALLVHRDLERTIEVSEQAIALGRQLQLPAAGLGLCRVARGVAQERLGRHREAIASLEVVPDESLPLGRAREETTLVRDFFLGRALWASRTDAARGRALAEGALARARARGPLPEQLEDAQRWLQRQGRGKTGASR